ncbi:hypothetical protein L210DRAFT_3509455 [Boletus edulis BED1]|uniref:Uncharacterized protein n=1 Tax=Boletus edulis BED1 TaxID=1328754 RepID=A0AAD4BEG8_BOLED|nr:hypothetical protein L210DRAFT_3509455 [Boletus edulis BED1]
MACYLQDIAAACKKVYFQARTTRSISSFTASYGLARPCQIRARLLMWDKLLQSDGIKVRAKAVKEEDEGSDIADEGSDDGESVQSDEVEEPEGGEQEGDVEETSDEEENCDLVDVIDDEDPIILDDDEILDDHILIQEGYGAL